MSNGIQSNEWISVCGKSDPQLSSLLSTRVEARHAANEFSIQNEAYIRDLTLAVTRKGNFECSEMQREMLRKLCSLHSVKLQLGEISSHRKYVGRFIVAGKKIAFRILRPFLEPMLRQQRAFNAEVIYMMADLANQKGKGPGE